MLVTDHRRLDHGKIISIKTCRQAAFDRNGSRLCPRHKRGFAVVERLIEKFGMTHEEKFAVVLILFAICIDKFCCRMLLLPCR
jgi:hypothetical protein